jgi:acetyltransferase-like isoleucine patch superfamily enzyme
MTDARLGTDCDIDAGATLGYDHDPSAPPTRLGDRARVRAGTIVYADVVAGDDLTTGHNALIREETTLGDDVVVGTDTVIDGACAIGSAVSLQTGVYVPRETTIADNVFVGPGAVLTNDRYPVRQDADLVGPTIEAGASVGANATVLPGVTIGENAFVAAGAVVTADVPPDRLAVGAPATTERLPESLAGGNQLA